MCKRRDSTAVTYAVGQVDLGGECMLPTERSQQERHWWPDRPPSDPVLTGLAVNSALPGGLLLRLVREHGGSAVDGLAHRPDLPAAVLAAMLGHPGPWVRDAAGRNPSITPEGRSRLLRDSDGLVRGRAESRWPGPLPESGFHRELRTLRRQLARGLLTEPEFDGEVVSETYRDLRRLPVLARHPDERFRLIACTLMLSLAESERRSLLDDPSPSVRAAAAAEHAEVTRPRTPEDLPDEPGWQRYQVFRYPLTPELVDRVVASGRRDDLVVIASNPYLTASVVAALAAHPFDEVRRTVASRPDLAAEPAVRLGADPDPSVRATVSVHPVLTENQLAAIDVDPDALPRKCIHLPVLPDRSPPRDPAAAARSVNPLLRRLAACDPELPASVALILAEDPDEGVRVWLAHEHPAAPPDLLLRVYLDHPGHPRRDLLKLPHFPVAGLARFADDPDPAVRILAARDPATDAATVERLLTDPDRTVQRAMAAHPNLPAGTVVALLGDPDLCGAAATNPALPLTEMHRLLARPRPAGRT
jgi:hypothetical protein